MGGCLFPFIPGTQEESLKARCDCTYGMYVICSDNLRTVGLRVRYFAVYVNRTLTSLYDVNKLRVSCLQPSSQKSALNVSLILANANNKND